MTSLSFSDINGYLSPRFHHSPDPLNEESLVGGGGGPSGAVALPVRLQAAEMRASSSLRSFEEGGAWGRGSVRALPAKMLSLRSRGQMRPALVPLLIIPFFNKYL